MADIDRIDHRLAAVERAVIDGDYEVDELGDLATLTEAVERLETRVDEQERRLAALEATTESLTGFVDNVESVNDDVERQAATAVATVDRLEERIDELESAPEALGRETADIEAGTGRSKTLAGSDSDGAGRPHAASTATEVAFSERETTSDDEGAKTPENAVSEIVSGGAGDDDDSGVDGGFEWGAEASAADGSAATAAADDDEPADSGGLLSSVRSRLS